MSNKKITKSKIILQRVKEFYDIGSDGSLAKFLGVSQPTISAWGKRDSLNYELIITKCNDISKDWLLTGEGPKKKTIDDFGISADNDRKFQTQPRDEDIMYQHKYVRLLEKTNEKLERENEELRKRIRKLERGDNVEELLA